MKEYFTADSGCASYVERDVVKQDAKLCIARGEGTSRWSFQQQQYLAYIKVLFSQKSLNLGTTSAAAYICAAAVIPEVSVTTDPSLHNRGRPRPSIM